MHILIAFMRYSHHSKLSDHKNNKLKFQSPKNPTNITAKYIEFGLVMVVVGDIPATVMTLQICSNK